MAAAAEIQTTQLGRRQETGRPAVLPPVLDPQLQHDCKVLAKAMGSRAQHDYARDIAKLTQWTPGQPIPQKSELVSFLVDAVTTIRATNPKEYTGTLGSFDIDRSQGELIFLPTPSTPAAPNPYDLARNGKFDGHQAIYNFCEGVFAPAIAVFEHPKTSLAVGAAAIGIGVLWPPAAVGFVAVGAGFAAWHIAKGVWSIAKAKDGDEVEKAFRFFGEGTTDTLLTLAGVKGVKAAAKVESIDFRSVESLKAVWEGLKANSKFGSQPEAASVNPTRPGQNKLIRGRHVDGGAEPMKVYWKTDQERIISGIVDGVRNLARDKSEKVICNVITHSPEPGWFPGAVFYDGIKVDLADGQGMKTLIAVIKREPHFRKVHPEDIRNGYVRPGETQIQDGSTLAFSFGDIARDPKTGELKQIFNGKHTVYTPDNVVEAFLHLLTKFTPKVTPIDGRENLRFPIGAHYD